jgi:hypothetical protein
VEAVCSLAENPGGKTAGFDSAIIGAMTIACAKISAERSPLMVATLSLTDWLRCSAQNDAGSFSLSEANMLPLIAIPANKAVVAKSRRLDRTMCPPENAMPQMWPDVSWNFQVASLPVKNITQRIA